MDLTDVDRMDARINRVGADLFFDPITTGYAAERGVTDVFVLYGAGRAGVMGDVTAEQVASAFCFFDPATVRRIWEQVPAFGTPSSIATVFVDAMAEAARARWHAEAAAVVARLGRRVADEVTPMAMALFAGWRAVAAPDDPVGAATVVVHALRELRGDIHVQSVAAAGLHPLEAELVTRGAEGARLHLWPEPWPDPEPCRERVAAAQHATSERMGAIYDRVLGTQGLEELAAAVDQLV